MLHPSYMELIDKVNEVNKEMGNPPIHSRYTLVMALAKRSRDLVNKDALMVPDEVNGRMLSQAVREMALGKIGVVAEDDE